MVYSVNKIRAVSLQRPTKTRSKLQYGRRQPIIRALRVNKARKLNLVHSKMHAVGFALALFCILLFKLYIRLNLLELSYQLEETRQSILLEDSKLREARVMNAKQLSSRNITMLAKERLGLSPSLPQQIRKLEIKG